MNLNDLIRDLESTADGKQGRNAEEIAFLIEVQAAIRACAVWHEINGQIKGAQHLRRLAGDLVEKDK